MIDVLGHPIEAGMTVLTNGYYSASMEVITTIDRVTEKSVFVTVYASWYDWKTRTRCKGYKSVRRRPNKVIVINKQLNYNKKTYPENLI